MRILIIDDEPSIRTTLKIFLEREGYEADSAETAMQAHELLEGRSYDIVFSDIIMPKISGVEFLDKIKQTLPDVPVVMMTGEPSVETAVMALQRGAFDYLNKPIQKSDLLKAVKHAAQFRLLTVQKRNLEQMNRDYLAHLEKVITERTADLDQSMQSTIRVMTSLVNSRDHYTSGHQIRVGNLSASIALEMGLSSFQATGIRVTGYLHDIGKLSVPSNILVKPSKLTQFEFDIVKTHAESGYRILTNLSLPWPVAEIAYQHHERLDGSGYPRGLNGDDILLGSRILTVADVIEAMTSHRPYRASLGIEVAIDEIVSKKGRAYDPDVVDACLAVMKRQNNEFESNYVETSFIDVDQIKSLFASPSNN